MQLFSGPTLFWLILALFYLVLALVTFISSRPVRHMFTKLIREGGTDLVTEEGEEISIENTMYRAYKGIITTDIIGFVFAAVAAVISVLL